MSIHDRVDLTRWLNRFPLDEHLRQTDEEDALPFRFYQPDDIFSPKDLAHTLQMQQRAGLDLKSGTPVDLLLPALGEPSNRAASKICGSPYRPRGTWPVDSRGTPLRFLAQLCFAESRDILPEFLRSNLPGDILLIFAEDRSDDMIWTEKDGVPLYFEWHSLGIPDDQLIPPGEHPENLFAPIHFQLLRTRESEDRGEYHGAKFAIEVRACLPGSKIGGIPIWQQDESEANGLGTFFAAIHSINPAGMEYPLINVPVPPWGPLPYGQNFLMLGDVGTLYLFWDGSRVRWLMQCG